MTTLASEMETAPAAGAPSSSSAGTLSMREKALLKRSISKSHSTYNGYVPVDDQLQLHPKTGLRGRKTFAFWTLVGLLFVLAVGNLMLTMTILGVLKLGQGMQSMELVPERGAIKFYGDTEFQDVYKRDGRLESFADVPLRVATEAGGSISARVVSRTGRSIVRFSMDANGTAIPNTVAMDVKDRHNQVVFTTTAPTYNLVQPAHNFDSRIMQTNRVVSAVDEKLQIESHSNVNVRGAEGVSIEGKEILLSADQQIFLRSVNGSLVLSNGLEDSVYVDMKKIPIVTAPLPPPGGVNVQQRGYGSAHVRGEQQQVGAQYKVCVCMPQGKLFRIPVPRESHGARVYCDHINMAQQNPCM